MKNTLLENNGRYARASTWLCTRLLRYFMLAMVLIGVTVIARAGTPLEQDAAVGGSLLTYAYYGRPSGPARLMKRRHAPVLRMTTGEQAGKVGSDNAQQPGARAACRSKRTLCYRSKRSRSTQPAHTLSDQDAPARECRPLRYRPRPMRHRC